MYLFQENIFFKNFYLKLKYTSFQCFDIDFKNVTCSSDVHCISCLALSIPSLVPVIRIRSDPSSAFGMEILVDVLNSNSWSFLPLFPNMYLWCSRGIFRPSWAYKIKSINAKLKINVKCVHGTHLMPRLHII